jgi:hypothetical protein
MTKWKFRDKTEKLAHFFAYAKVSVKNSGKYNICLVYLGEVNKLFLISLLENPKLTKKQKK